MADDRERADDAAQDGINQRKHERAKTVESILAGTEGFFDEEKYPATSEELAATYGDQLIDLPNETESLGSVFDRLVDERFESPQEAREAILGDLSGGQAGVEEYDDERALGELADEPAEER